MDTTTSGCPHTVITIVCVGNFVSWTVTNHTPRVAYVRTKRERRTTPSHDPAPEDLQFMKEAVLY